MSARTFRTGCNQAAARNISPGSEPAPECQAAPRGPTSGPTHPRQSGFAPSQPHGLAPMRMPGCPPPTERLKEWEQGQVSAPANPDTHKHLQQAAGQPLPVPAARKGRRGGSEGSHHFRRAGRSFCLLLPAPDGKTKLTTPLPEPPPPASRAAPCPTKQLRGLPSPVPLLLPSPLPGSKRPLAAQAQEAGGQQQAAQRRGQGDDSPHGALSGGSRRSGGRPIVFKAGGGQGEAAMAAQGRRAPPLALRRRHQPPSCLSAVPLNFPLRRRPPCGVGALWGRLLGCPAVGLGGSRVGSGSSTKVVAEGGSWRGAVPSGRRALVSVSYSSYTLSLFLYKMCCHCPR